MIPQRIHLCNFLAYSECDLDLRGVELACLSGPNGAGKSSLIDGLTWCVWGEARARTEDELFRTGTREMAAEVEFALDRNEYRVSRRRKRPASGRPGQSALDFELRDGGDGWRKLTGATIRETQAAIVQTIGCDYVTFVNASLMLQGRADEFARKPPVERKQVLAGILRLDVYDRLQELAKQRRNLAEAEVATLRAWLEDAEPRLAEQGRIASDLAVAQEALEEARTRLQTAEAELGGHKERLAALQERQHALQDAQGQVERLRERERTAQADLEQQRQRRTESRTALEGAADTEARYRRHEELGGLLSSLRPAQAERSGLESGIEARHGELARLRATAPDLATLVHCPTCGQALDDEAKAAVGAHYVEVYEAAEGIERVIAEMEDELHSLPDTSQLPAIQNEHDSLAGVVDDYAGLRAARERLTATDEAIGRLESDLGTIAEDLLAAQDRAQAAAFDGAELEALSATARDLERRMGDLRESERRDADQVASLRQRLADLEALRRERDERKARFDDTAARAQVYADLAAACGKGGVQALIIDSAIPEIKGIANDILGQLSGGRMTLDITTQRLTQAGGTRETLDIEIGDEMGTRAYEMFSGGERFRIDFALHLAMGEVLSRRAGAPIEILIVDEGFGTQDSEGMARLQEALTLARERFAMVLAITHVDELREAFPVRIEVQPSAEGSVVTVV